MAVALVGDDIKLDFSCSVVHVFTMRVVPLTTDLALSSSHEFPFLFSIFVKEQNFESIEMFDSSQHKHQSQRLMPVPFLES